MDQKIGDIKCNRIIHYRSKEEGSKEHPKIPGYVNINVTSGNSKWKSLSPMKLGPFHLIEQKVVTPWYHDGIHPGFTSINEFQQMLPCTNLENIWQGSKIFNIDLNKDNVIQPSFFERRKKMAYDIKPHRRALPKKDGVPISSYWDGKYYSYLDSRVIYCNLYTNLVIKTSEYNELVNMRNNGINLQIIGYDGQDIPINYESMKNAYLDPNKPFGHELVLCCLLTNISPWN